MTSVAAADDNIDYGYEPAAPFPSEQSQDQDAQQQAEDEVDYGYEEHAPSPRASSDFFVLPSSKSLGAPPTRRGSYCCPEQDQPGLDATEVSHSPSSSSRDVITAAAAFSSSHHHHHHGVTFSSQEPTSSELRSDDNYDPYYSPPASSHQKRRHNRRGGFVHGSLLRSAVMASMECPDVDDDTCAQQRNGYRQNSAISLQSLQDALRDTASSVASSPRKRARKVPGRDNDDDDAQQLDTLLTAMRVREPVPPALPKREPPVRRVSRKTSYDSRISDFSDWDDDEEIWEAMQSDNEEEQQDSSDGDSDSD